MSFPRYGGHVLTLEPTDLRYTQNSSTVSRRIKKLNRRAGSERPNPRELAEEFEPTEQTIRNWLKQADRDDGTRSDGPTTEEKEEIRKLRKKLRQLQQERDILAKATAWFARENGDVPPNSSDS